MDLLVLLAIGIVGTVIPIISPEVSAVGYGLKSGWSPWVVGTVCATGQCITFTLLYVGAAKFLPRWKGLNSLIERTRARFNDHLERRYLAVTVCAATIGLPPAIGVLFEFEGDDVETARGVAMQIASLRAQYLGRDDVPADVVDNERRIAEATAREEGKPEQALPKIVEGRVNGFFKDVVLVDQPYVRDNKKTVKQVLDEAGVTLKRFARFEVGA